MPVPYPRGHETRGPDGNFRNFRTAGHRGRTGRRGALAPGLAPGPSLQTLHPDGVAAVLARAARAVAEPPKRALELPEPASRLIVQCRELCALEPDRGAFGVVLVVGRLQRGRLDDRVELARELLDSGRGRITFRAQQPREGSRIVRREPAGRNGIRHRARSYPRAGRETSPELARHSRVAHNGPLGPR